MSMAQARSWWRMRQIRHRDAVVLSVLSASFLLAGEINDLRTAYEKYIAPYATQPQVVANVVLTVLGFTTAFGGIFVLRRTRPGMARPYRTWGYPALPAIYIAVALFIEIQLLRYKPQYTWPGLLLVLLGMPVYWVWKKVREEG